MRLIKGLVGILLWPLLLALCASLAAPRIAVLIDGRICMPLRSALSRLFAILHIPIFEILIVAIPILLIVALVRARLSVITTVAGMLLISYVVTLGVPSALPRRTPDTLEPTTDDYIRAATVIARGLGDTAPPSTDMRVEAASAAAKYARDTLAISGAIVPRIKATLAPNILAKIGVIAYYAFPTAEVVVNTAAPDFMIATASAHETMHLLGVTNEDEANLFAIAALLECGDESLKFCAYLCAFVYVGARLCTQDRDTYDEIYALLPDSARMALALRRDFLSARGGSLGAISSTLNDAAIALRDPRGADSYSASASLIVAYLLQ